MSWDEVGAIGQLLGSVAVFITLVYLSIQTRHARQESRRALGLERAEALRDMYALSSDERINRLITKAQTVLDVAPLPMQDALMEHAGFTREEAILLNWNQSAWWTYRLSIIPNVDELSALERTQFDWSIRLNYGSPGIGRLFYETFIKPNAHPDAVRYIDDVLAQTR